MSFGWLLQVCASSSAPRELSLSSTIISLVLSLVASPSNFLFCLAMYKDPHKNLRTPFNIFILNIAAADFVQGSAVLPLSAAFHGLEGVGKFSPQLLRALHLFFFISCTASIISIAALAVDRCISVSYPLKYRSKSTYSRSIRISIIIWFISAGLSFLYLQVDFILYIFVFVNSVILLTVIILLFVQFWIGRRLKKNRERREFRRPSLTNSIASMHGRNWNKMVKRDAKVTRTFFSILMLFLLLMAPSFIFAYLLNFCPSCDCVSYHVFRDLHFLFVLFPSSVNPFLFGWRLPHFRRTLRTIISRRSRNVGQDRSAGQQLESSTFEEDNSCKFYRIVNTNCSSAHKIFVIRRSKCGQWSPARDPVCDNILNGTNKTTDGVLNKSYQRYPEKEMSDLPEPQDLPPEASDTGIARDYRLTSADLLTVQMDSSF
ncbi:melanocyte-stimulating hormone receptor-like [Actinia tenebrosa]|uniref:Melanocyte-stimulating hormone receptor-like n=1 Tax=Actinia tenebrosa TaxID=6105 RepID=A0A6P8H685_ACTTE|nr:melanocyte-stimulating hormone receptor-like [Actinia tenebrosa]